MKKKHLWIGSGVFLWFLWRGSTELFVEIPGLNAARVEALASCVLDSWLRRAQRIHQGGDVLSGSVCWGYIKRLNRDNSGLSCDMFGLSCARFGLPLHFARTSGCFTWGACVAGSVCRLWLNTNERSSSLCFV
jgi:hypothetical protein